MSSDKKRKRAVSYREEWTKEFKWASKSPTGDQCARCTLCFKDVFIKHGGKHDLAVHARSKLHQQNSTSKSQAGSITNFTIGSSSSLQTQVSHAEGLYAYMVAEHNLPFALSDHASSIFMAMFPDSKIAKMFQCGRTKTGAIIRQALGPRAVDPVSTSMKRGPFSLLMDESNDVKDQKEVALIVRYFCDDEGKVVTKFWSMPVCNIATGKLLFEVVEQEFVKHDIPWENLIGFGCDNASTMLGKRNSVLSRLKEKQPHIYNLGCICHVAHTCAKKSCSELNLNPDKLLIDIFYYFHHCAKRLEVYREYQEFVQVPGHTLLKHGQTRWLSLEKCVIRTLEQWEALKSYFASEGETQRAEGINQRLQSHEMRLYFFFLKNVLPVFNRFNVLFQSEEPNIFQVAKRQEELLRSFLSRFLPMNVIRATTNITDIELDDQVPDDELVIGSEARSYITAEDLEGTSELKNFYKSVRKFFSTGANAIKEKFPFNDPVLNNLQILDPCVRDQCTRHMVEELMSRFPQAVPEEDKDKVIEEWMSYIFTDLTPELLDRTVTPVDRFWQLMGMKQEGDGTQLYPKLVQLMKFLLCLPHSNADTERVFSLMGQVKTEQRSCMSNATLNSLLAIKQNSSKCCYKQRFSQKEIQSIKSATMLDLKKV